MWEGMWKLTSSSEHDGVCVCMYVCVYVCVCVCMYYT